MAEIPTVYVVDPDKAASKLVDEICAEMRAHCKAFPSADLFLDAYEIQRPACLVTEMRLLGMNGIELHQALTADGVVLPVIFVLRHPETRLVVRAMQAGAVTVLEKPLSSQELWDAINKALAIESKALRIDARHTEVRRRIASLTQQERQVLELMIEGKANKWIAKRVDVSVRTIESRRRQVFKKTKTESVPELVRLYLQAGGKQTAPPVV